jgi:hypothetical protein
MSIPLLPAIARLETPRQSGFLSSLSRISGIAITRIKSFFVGQRYIGAILPLVILGLWQASSSFQWIEPVFLPAPIKVVQAFWYMLTRQDLLMDIRASVFIIAQAFLYGTLLGVGLGFAAGLSRPVELFFGATINTLRHIPTVAWIESPHGPTSVPGRNFVEQFARAAVECPWILQSFRFAIGQFRHVREKW